MSEGVRTEYERLDIATAARFDVQCDRFEDAWRATRAGAPVPEIESFLEGWEAEERKTLFCELLAIDHDYRVRFGLPARPLNDLEPKETVVAPLVKSGGPSVLPGAQRYPAWCCKRCWASVGWAWSTGPGSRPFTATWPSS